MSALEQQLRDLHAPVESYGHLQCDGCDFEPNYEGEPPAWPCRTAELVYSAEEIADWTDTFESWRKWGRDRNLRERLASGWDFNDDMGLMMRPMIQRMLRPMPYFDTLAKADTVKRGTVVIPISRSLMADVDSE